MQLTLGISAVKELTPALTDFGYMPKIMLLMCCLAPGPFVPRHCESLQHARPDIYAWRHSQRNLCCQETEASFDSLNLYFRRLEVCC